MKLLLAWNNVKIYIYSIDEIRCNELIEIYDKSGRQLFKLACAWNNFKDDRRNPYTKRAS